MTPVALMTRSGPAPRSRASRRETTSVAMASGVRAVALRRRARQARALLVDDGARHREDGRRVAIRRLCAGCRQHAFDARGTSRRRLVAHPGIIAGRASAGGGSAWESNPPRDAGRRATGFEDRGTHRDPSAPKAAMVAPQRGRPGAAPRRPRRPMNAGRSLQRRIRWLERQASRSAVRTPRSGPSNVWRSDPIPRAAAVNGARSGGRASAGSRDLFGGLAKGRGGNRIGNPLLVRAAHQRHPGTQQARDGADAEREVERVDERLEVDAAGADLRAARRSRAAPAGPSRSSRARSTARC